MNIFFVMQVACTILAAIACYHLALPAGLPYGVAAALGGAVAGFFAGPVVGFLFILPFEGVARLVRFLNTGRWTDPPRVPQNTGKNEDDHVA